MKLFFSTPHRLAASIGLISLLGATVLITPPALAQTAAQQTLKIGFVQTERILRESAPAKEATQRIESAFNKTDQELVTMSKNLKNMVDKLERDAAVMSNSDAEKLKREISDLDRELKRKQAAFREDVAQRRNEELAKVIELANNAIRQIAESEKYDLIFQDAVYANPRIDLTERVIKALAKK